MSELDLNAPITEWELDEWTPDARAELTTALIESGIAHKWEQTVLLTASAVENEVEEILDEIENNNETSDDSDDSDDDDDDDAKMSQMQKFLDNFLQLRREFRATHRIRIRFGVLERLLEEIDGANAPGEISDSVWRQIKDLANQIEEALVGSAQPDESTAMDLAGRLFAILRSNV